MGKAKDTAIWAAATVGGGFLGMGLAHLIGVAGVILGIPVVGIVGYALFLLWKRFFGGPRINR